jgi:hypothetical protein
MHASQPGQGQLNLPVDSNLILHKSRRAFVLEETLICKSDKSPPFGFTAFSDSEPALPLATQIGELVSFLFAEQELFASIQM